MTLRCPNCREAQPFGCRFSKEWRCAACGSLLAFGKCRPALPGFGRYLLYLLAAFSLLGVATTWGLLSRPQYNWLFLRFLPVLIAVYLLLRLPDRFMHREVVVRTRVGRHCRVCGYDLRCQTEPRCPECGTAFDAALLDSRTV